MAAFGVRLADRLRAFARPWELASFVWVPSIVLAYAFWQSLRASTPLDDFGIFRIAARRVLDGESPYVAPDPQALAHFDKFVYPPGTALLFAPFTAIPLRLGSVLMLVLGLAAVLVALRLLDVVDWRCYGVAVMSAPVINSLALGAVTTFLLVGAAAAWRYRDRPLLAGPCGALTACVKLFLWPLWLWLLATRRYRAAVVFAAVAVAAVLGGWVAIGFAGLAEYPHLVHVLAQVEQGASYSPVAFLGLSGSAATIVTAGLAALTVAAIVAVARGEDGDRRAFTIALAGSLVATPVVWLHYEALLLVPIALYRPRLSGLWFVPLALWLTPASHANGSAWKIGLALAVLGVVVARLVADGPTQRLLDRASSLRVRSTRAVGEVARAE